MSRTLPHLLEPYILLPSSEEAQGSLTLLTSILGASTNWLVLRCLYSFLKNPTPATSSNSAGDVSVVLVSFLRDYTFFREGASRLGLDLEALKGKGRFLFVDGLGGLFLGGDAEESRGQREALPQIAGMEQRGDGLEQRGKGGVSRGLPQRGALPLRGAGGGVPSGAMGKEESKRTITRPAIAEAGKVLRAAVDELGAKGGKVVLVVDQLDLLLAAAGGEGGISSVQLRELLLELREKTHAAVVTLAADEPLINSQMTTLEREHASFVMSLAHEAGMVISLRLLDTGTAKDVSGVMRITRGGDDYGLRVEEGELLYHVGGDGGVRVFERGQ